MKTKVASENEAGALVELLPVRVGPHARRKQTYSLPLPPGGDKLG